MTKFLLLTLTIAATASAHSARTLNCGELTGPPPPQIGQIRESGTSCKVARTLAADWKHHVHVRGWHHCPDARHTCGRIDYFRCAEYTPDPRYPGSFMFCRRGDARVRWTEG